MQSLPGNEDSATVESAQVIDPTFANAPHALLGPYGVSNGDLISLLVDGTTVHTDQEETFRFARWQPGRALRINIDGNQGDYDPDTPAAHILVEALQCLADAADFDLTVTRIDPQNDNRDPTFVISDCYDLKFVTLSDMNRFLRADAHITVIGHSNDVFTHTPIYYNIPPGCREDAEIRKGFRRSNSPLVYLGQDFTIESTAFIIGQTSDNLTIRTSRVLQLLGLTWESFQELGVRDDVPASLLIPIVATIVSDDRLSPGMTQAELRAALAEVIARPAGPITPCAALDGEHP